MTAQGKITICEKPDYITYDDIHELLWKANEQNRESGFILRTSMLTGGEIKSRIGPDGKCFVALDEGRLVATSSFRIVDKKKWYARCRVIDIILSGVLPEYQGQHLNSRLKDKIFSFAKNNGYNILEFDTAEKNTHMIDINKNKDFIPVDFKANPGGDHYSVIMAKWLNGCPYSTTYCQTRYLIKKLYVRFRYKANKKKRFGI